MSESYEQLKKIGIQKVSEDTHISRIHIQAVMDQSFDKLNKVQLLGFISILEREYSLDLSEIRANGIGYYQEKEADLKANPGVFVVAKHSKNFNLLYIILIMVVFIGVLIFSVNFAAKDDSIEVQSVENKIIQEVKKDIASTQVEDNVSDTNITETVVPLDTNVSKASETIKEEPVVPVKKEELAPFKIIAKSKVWVGYIDVKTNKRYSKVVKDSLSLNREKEWLVVLGHSHVKIEANNDTKSFSTNGKLRLLYKEGKVERITVDKFKKLNRGRKW